MVDFADNIWAFKGQDGLNRSHVPAHPIWVGFLRVAQLVVAFIVFVLTAVAAGKLDASGLAGFGLTWFTFIWMLGYFAYLVVSLLFQPAIYNYWVHLGLESLTVIWWLCTWAVLASEASVSTRGLPLSFFPKYFRTATDCIKASAGLGALVWLLFLATLAFLVMSVLSHRKTEASQNPQPAPMSNIPPGGPGGQVPQQQQQPAYPQQAYQPAPAEGYPQGQYPPQQYPVQQQQQQQPQQPYQGGGEQVPDQQGSPYQQTPYPPPQQQQQQQAPYPQ